MEEPAVCKKQTAGSFAFSEARKRVKAGLCPMAQKPDHFPAADGITRLIRSLAQIISTRSTS